MPTLNQQQRRQTLLTTLACGATVAQAAAQAGLSERTVYRYLAEATFRQQLEALQAETLQCSAARLTAAAPEALKVLLELQDPATPPSVRRAAARDLVELSRRHREILTLEKRLIALETLPDSQADRSNLQVYPNGGKTQAVPGAPADAVNRPRRKRATPAVLNALASGATIAQAAAKAGLSKRTVYRRLANPAFRQQLRALQAEMAQRAADLLLASTLQATKTLLDLLAPSTPACVRRAAARDILELGLCLRQAVELEDRLSALEIRGGLRPAA